MSSTMEKQVLNYLELRFKSHAVRLLGTILGILTYETIPSYLSIFRFNNMTPSYFVKTVFLCVLNETK
ncbi:hypothetical protein KUTeg_012307 [Tegillarca granosa]|uniref:Uncharacterized protein n=1 Tax=Tegillarca granosa TaxID=220873 RepID=A0ABQ9F2F6_TEGGR|nr:hypothetical protein KUTeg_012307 [Tegillarca granosa]